MAAYFFDTSALVKRFHVEFGTRTILSLFDEPQSRIMISRIGQIVCILALALKVRCREATAAGFQVARRRFHADIKNRVLNVIRLRVAHFQLAEDLIVRRGLSQRIRTLDALQLAVALHGFRAKHIDRFVCADGLLCEVSEAEGLSTMNPTVVA